MPETIETRVEEFHQSKFAEMPGCKWVGELIRDLWEEIKGLREEVGFSDNDWKTTSTVFCERLGVKPESCAFHIVNGIEKLKEENEKLRERVKFVEEDRSVIAGRCANEIESSIRLRQGIEFYGKWIERGLFCKHTGLKPALKNMFYYGRSPWNNPEWTWDVSHTEYAAKFKQALVKE